MGLDMYARTLDERPPKPVDFHDSEEAAAKWRGEDLHYWRKHPNLHGWMETLYFNKGGKGIDGMDGAATFNCTPVVLDSEDLDRLEEAINERRLPHTGGFFFGESRPEDAADDREFIAKARAAIAAGKTVYYDSWW